MKQFFKFFFASILAIFTFIFLCFILLMAIGLSGDKPVKVKKNSVLKISLNKEIVDRATENPFEDFDFLSGESKKKMGLYAILTNIKRAETDDKISGILLEVSNIPAGTATVQEIRNALIRFKESGKFIVAYSEYYSQKAYYLASVADEIYLYPQGFLELKGLSRTSMFLKGALEKLEVEAQIIRGRNNKFKSAVEPLMYDKMSDANKIQTMKYLSSLWGTMKSEIAQSRGLSVSDLDAIADSIKTRTALDAVELRLIDGIKFQDEITDLLREKTAKNISDENEKEEQDIENDKVNYLALRKYIKAGKPAFNVVTGDKVSVVFAQGDIESGGGDEYTIGSDRIAKAVRDAREDENCKAIVLRVNSPGGSALASDVIWREVDLAQQVKPVVVSMGDVAASGGYYISCYADTIMSNSTTITGSIGVFGVLPNAKNLFNNKLGITFDNVKTNAFADMGGIDRALTSSEYNIIQSQVETVYDVFKNRVATGRNMAVDSVDFVGQGRVWSGSDAKDIGLVDLHGGLMEAIDLAAEMGGVTDLKVESLPKQKDPIQQMVEEMMGESEARIAESVFGPYSKTLSFIQKLSQMEGVQARLPYELVIE